MKSISLIGTLMILLLGLESCSERVYYQIYKTVPIEGVTMKNDSVFYENRECRVTYNFWGERGRAGFVFLNKSDKIITIHLDQCFFIKNGQIFDYYKNREYVSGSGREFQKINWMPQKTDEITSAITTSSSIITKEKEMLTILPNTSRFVYEYDVTDILYRDCSLFRFPNGKAINTVKFSRNDSPIKFANMISYSIEGTSGIQRIENGFYVGEISNYRSKDVLSEISVEYCKQISMKFIYVLKNPAPNLFYMKYKGSSFEFFEH